MPVTSIRDHAFFEQTKFEGLFGDDFLQLLGLPPEVFDLASIGGALGVTG